MTPFEILELTSQVIKIIGLLIGGGYIIYLLHKIEKNTKKEEQNETKTLY